MRERKRGRQTHHKREIEREHNEVITQIGNDIYYKTCDPVMKGFEWVPFLVAESQLEKLETYDRLFYSFLKTIVCLKKGFEITQHRANPIKLIFAIS
jgi:hypothetical protein